MLTTKSTTAETDSDPIVESDTTDHSGDDDGVSWPSDDNDLRPPTPKSTKPKQSDKKDSNASKATLNKTSKGDTSTGGTVSGW